MFRLQEEKLVLLQLCFADLEGGRQHLKLLASNILLYLLVVFRIKLKDVNSIEQKHPHQSLLEFFNATFQLK